MNCNTAKRIKLIEFFKKLGFTPKKITNNDTWFLSPFRNETTPSLKINNHNNIWYDFGEGCGGNILDFVMKLHQCDIKKSLEILSSNNFSFHQQKEKTTIPEKSNYSITKVAELSHFNLIDYLNSRKINIEFAKQFLFQVHYSFDSIKEYYGIGFMNDFGGWEIRNKSFKGCLGKKSITTINNNSDVICLFESWSDFLSYLTLKKHIPEENFIILNSTSLIKKTFELIEGYSKIKCFFDNDEAADNAFNIICKYSNVKVEDYRVHYKKFKDLNIYLQQKNNKSL
ncbi:toprim domain-containing protein [Polaribacter sp. L3A8]|uniref:toprim domain-containing protein n=1 Tax=Polaribacter sp. L3A8 TaxID=2686361 RepID=UPI00131C335F|nr:toprim domain-containing protein [Polaribacter sp. L3A8]